MKAYYSMSFYDNKSELVLSKSDLNFMPKQLDISELKNRFNNDFVKNKNVACVKFNISLERLSKSFVAGFKSNSVVIIDVSTKKEYSVKEFRSELDTLENILAGIEEPTEYLIQ